MAYIERDMRLSYAQNYYKTNRDAMREQQKQWRESSSGSRHRFSRTVNNHGITTHDWALMWVNQNGRCAGCMQVLDGGRHTYIDHCHKTEKVRGLLCSECNLALGKVNDSIETLFRLAEYVRNGGQRGKD
jgi:hypothetical protein